MEQHPIPQNVTQYQFRLIGNMTLKQFAMLGACILCAFIFSKLLIIPPIFRYPLVVIFVSLGLALAFLPFEERSLDIWLINFIKSIYNPTQYLWRVSGELPSYLVFDAKNAQLIPKRIELNKGQLIQPYIKSMQQKPQNPIDEYEEKRTNNISAMFNDNVPPQTHTNPSQKQQNYSHASQQTQYPLLEEQEKTMVINKTPSPLPQLATPISQPTTPTPNIQSTATVQTNPKNPIIVNAPPILVPLKIKSLKPDLSSVANMPPIFSEDQMPPTPDLPNTIVGAIMTKSGQLIPNAIIEIRDETNLPVRAIKSNRLGQFFIATPLNNGIYTLIIEHDTLSFDTIKIEANGNIILPLKIISNSD